MNKAVDSNFAEKTEIFLLAGFLGSGKTTLLNRVLSWEEDLSDTVVLVNEFGKIGIDGEIIKSKSNGNDVVELTSGCICCTLTDELIDTLESIWEQYRPRRILLEATGVAEPDAITKVIESESLQNRMIIQKKITVMGIRYWLGREAFGPFIMSQIEQADLILLNKLDTVSKDKIQKAVEDLRAHTPGCLVIPTLYADVDPEVFWNRPTTRRLNNFYTSMPSSAVDAANEIPSKAGITYDTFDFVSETPLDEHRFEGFLKNLPWQLFRIKGPVRFRDRTALLNYVSGQIDWQEWANTDQTRLAFIGFDVDMEKIRGNLNVCIAG